MGFKEKKAASGVIFHSQPFFKIGSLFYYVGLRCSFRECLAKLDPCVRCLLKGCRRLLRSFGVVDLFLLEK